MFGFRRNTRLRVKLIEPFLNLLTSRLKEKGFSFDQPTQAQTKSQLVMRRQIEFENRLNISKLLKWNPQCERRYWKGEVGGGKGGGGQQYHDRGGQASKQEATKQEASKQEATKQEMVNKILQSHLNTNNNDNNPHPHNYHSSLNNPHPHPHNSNLEPNNPTQSSHSQQTQPIKPIQPMKPIKPSYEIKQYSYNTLQPYLICYQVLSDILASPSSSSPKSPTKKSLNLGLIEPISKVSTSIVAPHDKRGRGQEMKERGGLGKGEGMDERERELAELEEELERRGGQGGGDGNNRGKGIIRGRGGQFGIRGRGGGQQQYKKTEKRNNNNNKSSTNHNSNNTNKPPPPVLTYTKKSPPITITDPSPSPSTLQPYLKGPTFTKLPPSELQTKIKTRKEQLAKQLKRNNQVNRSKNGVVNDHLPDGGVGEGLEEVGEKGVGEKGVGEIGEERAEGERRQEERGISYGVDQ